MTLSAPPAASPPPTEAPRLTRCHSCQAPIWWGLTAKGKRCPFNWDLVTGKPTHESHFRTCPQAKTWSKR